MKNIHVLPTDKSSRVSIKDSVLILHRLQYRKDTQHIYITFDEEIKVGDWFITNNNEIFECIKNKEEQCFYSLNASILTKFCKKIIITDNKDLIKDGVQAIDDEFLEWFVKNPSCEWVKIEFNNRGITGAEKILKTFGEYKIIIPKEEPKKDLEKEMFELEQELDIPSHLRWHNSKPKQETLEEDSKFYFENDLEMEQMIKEMALTGKVPKKWSLFISKINNLYKQQERMYSEDEVLDILNEYRKLYGREDAYKSQLSYFIEQFKNK